jgi:general secretion pathway protein D
MRLTTFSVVATLLFAAGLVTFWPGRNAAPGVSAAVAQVATVTSQSPDSIDPFAGGEPSLQEKLNKRIDFDVVEMPLKDVAAWLQEQHGIQVILSVKKLEEAGVSPDIPVTKSLKRVKVSTALELMLKDLELTWVEKDELLLITTPEDAESTMEVRVYDCRDLLTMQSPERNFGAGNYVPGAATPQVRLPGSGAVPAAPAADPFGSPRSTTPAKDKPSGVFGGRLQTEHERKVEQLIEIATNNIDPDTWDTAGGPGSIGEYNGLIVVTQTADTHKKVERLFDMLREAAGLEVPRGGKVVR